jgi:type I restriction enzyme S subunit
MLDCVYINSKCIKDLQLLKSGDVVITASTGSKSVIGKAASVKNNFPKSSFGAFCLALRPNTDIVDPDYFGYFFQSKSYRENISRMSSGANINNLKREYFERLTIEVPSFEEQRGIVGKLDRINLLIQKRKEAITLLEDYLTSVFLDMFGDPVLNTKNWKTLKFEDVGTLERGKSKHRPRNAPELLGGTHPLIQTGDVSNAGTYIETFSSTYSDLGLLQSKKWPKGTLCITIAANIAKTGILAFDACFPDSVVGFIPNEKLTNNEFILFWMSFLQKSLEEMAPESAQKNINLEILRKLDVIVPPIDIQGKFVQQVRKVELVKKIFLISNLKRYE